MSEPKDKINNGWILLSSGIVDSPIFREDSDVLKLWIILLTAAHRSRTVYRVKGREVQYAEVFFSLSDLAKKLRRKGNKQRGEPAWVEPSRQAINRWLINFERDGMIERAPSLSGGTLIKILNFEFYQKFTSYAPCQADSSEHIQRLEINGEKTNYTTVCGQEHTTDPVSASKHKRNFKRTPQTGIQADSQADSSETNEVPESIEELNNQKRVSGQVSGQRKNSQVEHLDHTTTALRSKVSIHSNVSPSSNLSNIKVREVAPPVTRPKKSEKQGKPPVLAFNYETGNWNRKPLPEEVRSWREAYPGIDIKAEFMGATLWLRENSHRRKKRFVSFILRWFSKAQRSVDSRMR